MTATKSRNAPKVNYSIRPNKSIERKLIFEILKFLDATYKFDGYAYIGFGSLWFIDFIMAHRLLKIQSFFSIEKELPNRAEFNKPYEFITVYPGGSDEWLKTILTDTKNKRLIWLDYESTIVDKIVLDDIETLSSELKSNDILIITLNAESRNVKKMSGIKDPLKGRFEFLKDKVKNAMPPRIEGRIAGRKFCWLSSKYLI